MLRYFDRWMFCIVHRSNQCVPIFRSIRTKLMNLENMQKSYVSFDVKWRKHGTSHLTAALDTSDWYFHQEHFATNQKSLQLPVQRL